MRRAVPSSRAPLRRPREARGQRGKHATEPIRSTHADPDAPAPARLRTLARPPSQGGAFLIS
eukprot:185299-Prymnesium_polylepis.1